MSLGTAIMCYGRRNVVRVVTEDGGIWCPPVERVSVAHIRVVHRFLAGLKHAMYSNMQWLWWCGVCCDVKSRIRCTHSFRMGESCVYVCVFPGCLR